MLRESRTAETGRQNTILTTSQNRLERSQLYQKRILLGRERERERRERETRERRERDERQK